MQLTPAHNYDKQSEMLVAIISDTGDMLALTEIALYKSDLCHIRNHTEGKNSDLGHWTVLMMPKRQGCDTRVMFQAESLKKISATDNKAGLQS